LENFLLKTKQHVTQTQSPQSNFSSHDNKKFKNPPKSPIDPALCSDQNVQSHKKIKPSTHSLPKQEKTGKKTTQRHTGASPRRGIENLGSLLLWHVAQSTQSRPAAPSKAQLPTRRSSHISFTTTGKNCGATPA